VTVTHQLWRIAGARHGQLAGVSHGIWRPGLAPDQFEQLLESHGEGRLGIESGQPVSFIRLLPADATDEQRFDALAEATGWGETWAQQQERLRIQDESTED